MELKILEFFCGIKLGTSDHLMLVSEYYRPLTCTRLSTESGKLTLTEVCSFQSEGSQCLSLCQETQTGERIPYVLGMLFSWWITLTIKKWYAYGFCLVLFHFGFWVLVLVSFFCTKLDRSSIPSIFSVMNHYKLWPGLNLFNVETELRVFLGHGTTGI